jgi:hypothetical protein
VDGVLVVVAAVDVILAAAWLREDELGADEPPHPPSTTATSIAEAMHRTVVAMASPAYRSSGGVGDSDHLRPPTE